MALEGLRAVVLSGLMVFLWQAGRGRSGPSQRGWRLVIGGFGLLLFGSLLDMTDNVEGLERFVVIGDTQAQAFLEKFVGFLGGSVVLVLGLARWLPGVRRTAELRNVNADLEAEIAERERAEKALRVSEERLARAQQIAKIGYWGWSLGEEGMHYVSRQYTEIFGLPHDRPPRNQEECNRLIHPEDRDRATALFQAVTKDPQDYEIEYRIVRPDGEVRHVVEIGQLTFDDAGRPIGHTGTIQDITSQRSAQEALRVSEARLAGILDIAPEAVISIDESQHVRLFNQGAEALFGYSSDEVIGRPVEILIPPRHRKSHLVRFEDFARSGETSPLMSRRGEIPGLRKDGSEFPAEASISKLELGETKAFTIMLRDITERKQAETAIRDGEARATAAEQRLLDAIECISDGFVLYDSEDRLVLSNSKWREFYGYPDARVGPGTPYQDLVRLDVELGAVADEEADYVRRRIDYRRRFEGSFEVPLADGRWITIRERRTSDGGIVGVQSDITERKRAEDAIRESEQQFRAVVDNSPSAIFLKDMAGRYRLVNKRFEEWFGRSPEEALGRVSHDILPKEYADAYTAQDREVVETGRVLSREHQIPFADGTLRLVVVTKFPVFDSQNRAVGVGTIGTDLTNLKRSEAALLAAKVEAEIADRAKSEFLANMSHELRTPLNAIIGFSELIEKESLGPVGTVQYREHAQDIAASGRHLLKLINDILDLSKIEAGKVDLHEQDIDVSEAIRSSLVLVGGRAHHEGVRFHQDTPEDLPMLHADERMLKQMLINLLSNAVKFSPGGGTVTVRAWAGRREGYVLQISDTGIGMTLEDIPKAMVRFGQVDNMLNRRFQGTGLGLPLTKSLVDLHGGTLDLDSELGVGTRVTIRFPAERIVGLPKIESLANRIDEAAS